LGFLLLAQQAGEPLNGWGSLVLQTGFGGLLTYVIVRLAPAMLRESREEREGRDKLITHKDELLSKTVTGLADTHRESLKEIAATFERVNEKLVAHCDKKMAEVIEGYDRQVERLIAALGNGTAKS
jgi:hypothetical protein